MEYTNDPDYVLASKISLEKTRAYLAANGWRIVKTPRRDVDTYLRPKEEKYNNFIIVPKQDGDRTVPAILDVARKLQDYEKRDLMDVLYSLQSSSHDRVQCRLISSTNEDGTVPLSSAIVFVKQIAAVFSAALKDVIQSEFVHKKVASSEITELLNSAKFGQTERGSFIANIYLPLGQSSDAELFEDARSNLFRRSLEHLMKSLSQATTYIDEGRFDDFIKANTEAEIKTSANLLEAVDNARVGDDSDLEISVNWSFELPVDSSVPSRVHIKKEHSQTLWKWASHYRPMEQQMPKSEFIAKVIGLRLDNYDKSGRLEGFATLRIIDEEDFEAQAYLNADEFLLANECFMNNRLCSFLGECERSRNKAIIKSISDFKVIEPLKGASEQ